jgi:hypothetical protein
MLYRRLCRSNKRKCISPLKDVSGQLKLGNLVCRTTESTLRISSSKYIVIVHYAARQNQIWKNLALLASTTVYQVIEYEALLYMITHPHCAFRIRGTHVRAKGPSRRAILRTNQRTIRCTICCQRCPTS